MSRVVRRACTVAVGVWLVVAPTAAPVARATTITVVNNDGAGEGFNDPTPVAPVGGNTGTTLGAQRLIAFQFAANIWASLVNSGVTIQVGATFDPLPCSMSSAKLGQAGPHTYSRDFAGALVANTWYPIALANALAGMDLDPGNDDIDAQFNSVFGNGCAFPGSFYLGLDANPPGLNDSDFVSVVLHELCHGLGFLTLVDISTGAKAPPTGLDDVFTLNLEDHSTGVLWPAMTDAQRVTSSIDTGDLHWVGASVVAAGVTLTSGRHASGHVEMFAPNPQQSGSSVSHFSNALFPDEIMEPVYTGPNHDPGLAVALLDDLGWSVNTPPSTTTTIGTSTTSTSSTSSTTLVPVGDAYMCDKAAVNPPAGGVKFDRSNLPTRSLQDQFGTETCQFKKENAICPPAQVGIEPPPTYPAIHEVSYLLHCPSVFSPTAVTAVDWIFPGGVPVTLLKKFNVLVPSGKIDLSATPPPPPQSVPPAPPALTVDHFLCYKVRGPVFSPPGLAQEIDQFYPSGSPLLSLLKMTKLCTPVNKQGEDPTAPNHAGHLTCYRAKLPKGTAFNRTYVSTNNTNFGAQVLKVTNTSELCLPALKIP